MATPDTCVHENFQVIAEMARIGEDDQDNPRPGYPRAYSLAVRAKCTDCEEPFVFFGVEAGLLPDQPCASPDGTELRAPCRPQSAPATFGQDIAGFIVSSWTSGGNN